MLPKQSAPSARSRPIADDKTDIAKVWRHSDLPNSYEQIFRMSLAGRHLPVPPQKDLATVHRIAEQLRLGTSRHVIDMLLVSLKHGREKINGIA